MDTAMKETAAHTSTNEKEGKAEDHQEEEKAEELRRWSTKTLKRKQKLCGIKQYFAAMFLVVGFSTVMFTSVMVHAFTLGSLTVIPVVLKLLCRGNESKCLAGFKEIVDAFQTGCNCVLNLFTRITGKDVAAKVDTQFGCTMRGAVDGAVGGTLGGLAYTFLRLIHPYFGQAVGSALGATLGWTIGKTFTADILKKHMTTDKDRRHDGAVAGALGGSIGAFFGFLKGGVVGGLAGGVIGMITDTYLQTNQTKRQTHTDKPNQSSIG
ncbi:uncharacterized protein LOC121719583 [Alosa sapidissima]|uniref:uncharacterized protein LOC121719583 n=1 Tax=Alosa sapidissima TaxID=34773 RepID=UPI001C0810DB|nr:uncharacterized protein LOC121719583 [Alosa sapidissima]